MGLFDNMLGSNESIFMDPVALDYDYIPKLVPHREKEQKHIASCIQPLFAQRNGKNLLIYGQPGIGKTVACKHVIRELEETTEEIIPLYINCWKKNRSHKIAVQLCEDLGYKFTQNKKTDEILDIVINMMNKKNVVLVLDEIDKAEDLDFLYTILEEVYRKTIILITNFKDWINHLDQRIKSRLTAEMMEFLPYNEKETEDILRNRLTYSFVKNVWEDDAFKYIAKKTGTMGDIRSGLYLMKESGNMAEEKSSRKITLEHVKLAEKKLDDFTIKKSTDLDTESQDILDVIKQNPKEKIGDLYKKFTSTGKECTYKTFQRRIEKLQLSKFITTEKIMGGTEGTTTIVKYSKVDEEKKLSDF